MAWTHVQSMLLILSRRNITKTFMKMFVTKSDDVVAECQQAFRFQPICNQINCRKIKFLNRYVTSPNCICTIACNQCAVNEIKYLIAERPNVLEYFIYYK